MPDRCSGAGRMLRLDPIVAARNMNTWVNGESLMKRKNLSFCGSALVVFIGWRLADADGEARTT